MSKLRDLAIDIKLGMSDYTITLKVCNHLNNDI